MLPAGWTLKDPGLYEANGILSLPRPPSGPGQLDAAGYNLRMGYCATFSASRIRLLREDRFSAWFELGRWASKGRQWLSSALSDGIETDGSGRGVILGMAMGASDAAGDEVEDAFRNSGTLHIFAVSGLHVVVVAGLAAIMLRLLGLNALRGSWLLVIVVFVYAFLTGWRPSAARAAFMVAIMLAGPILNRQSSLQNSLGAAALALLAFDSHQFFAPGFQLSFGVLWAIALFASRLMNRARPWTELDSFLPPVLAGRRDRAAVWAKRKVASLLAVSLAAWAGSFPLLMGHFRTVTPVALVANCILVPMSSMSIGLSCASLACAAVHLHSLQQLLNRTNCSFAHGMIASASWFANLPMANFHVKLDARRGEAEMRVFQLQGGGAANMVRHRSSTWLLDCGGRRGWRQAVWPCLKFEGIDRLDGLILSHGDADHAGAAPTAWEVMHVKELHTSLLEPWRYDPPSSTMRQLSRLSPPDGPQWRRHGAFDKIALGDDGAFSVTAQVLYPRSTDIREKADDRAMVLMIECGGLKILWLGDAGFATEKALLERKIPLRCDILIRNQHATDLSGLAELFVEAQPQALISSNDPRTVEERMPLRVVNYCHEAEIPLFDLYECGSVDITFDGAEAHLQGFANRQTTVITPRAPAATPVGK
jgi:ComEC/Rec2-related protein